MSEQNNLIPINNGTETKYVTPEEAMALTGQPIPKEYQQAAKSHEAENGSGDFTKEQGENLAWLFENMDKFLYAGKPEGMENWSKKELHEKYPIFLAGRLRGNPSLYTKDENGKWVIDDEKAKEWVTKRAYSVLPPEAVHVPGIIATAKWFDEWSGPDKRSMTLGGIEEGGSPGARVKKAVSESGGGDLAQKLMPNTMSQVGGGVVETAANAITDVAELPFRATRAMLGEGASSMALPSYAETGGEKTMREATGVVAADAALGPIALAATPKIAKLLNKLARGRVISKDALAKFELAWTSPSMMGTQDRLKLLADLERKALNATKTTADKSRVASEFASARSESMAKPIAGQVAREAVKQAPSTAAYITQDLNNGKGKEAANTAIGAGLSAFGAGVIGHLVTRPGVLERSEFARQFKGQYLPANVFEKTGKATWNEAMTTQRVAELADDLAKLRANTYSAQTAALENMPKLSHTEYMELLRNARSFALKNAENDAARKEAAKLFAGMEAEAAKLDANMMRKGADLPGIQQKARSIDQEYQRAASGLEAQGKSESQGAASVASGLRNELGNRSPVYAKLRETTYAPIEKLEEALGINSNLAGAEKANKISERVLKLSKDFADQAGQTTKGKAAHDALKAIEGKDLQESLYKQVEAMPSFPEQPELLRKIRELDLPSLKDIGAIEPSLLATGQFSKMKSSQELRASLGAEGVMKDIGKKYRDLLTAASIMQALAGSTKAVPASVGLGESP